MPDHVAGVCQQFLQDEGIEAVDWPARSPDLNLIEHIWDSMSRIIQQHHIAPQTVHELVDALVQVWEKIPQETIRCLIKSMPRRYFSDVPCAVRSLPPQWYHTVQVRRIRSLRARSNSDPLQGKNLGQGFQWQRKGLPFGNASSYLNLEKLGEGSYATHGNQGKHRVTKRGPALSYPMFTLVTSEDIAGSVSHTPIQRCLQGVQRRNKVLDFIQRPTISQQGPDRWSLSHITI
ncbi:unnamed protein product [Ranitomeya imitator]|uniref:Tc1-like transposase DDE domain-containing protein n=1 Tax=Ranitomeya imitator TaxID=111125 RepID=A0ABN9MW18_9NEOB|nr:unnamed protein product [Ranitomeya imitator]